MCTRGCNVYNDRMTKAVWNGKDIAESDDIVLVESFAYFPMASAVDGCMRENGGVTLTYCHWKGVASYCDLVVDGEVNVGRPGSTRIRMTQQT